MDCNSLSLSACSSSLSVAMPLALIQESFKLNTGAYIPAVGLGEGLY